MKHNVGALRRKCNNQPVSLDSLPLQIGYAEHRSVNRFFVTLIVFALRCKH